MYEKSLIFWNIGVLLPPLNVEMLKLNHPSIKRNVLIADIFYRSGAIEAWGRGIKLMLAESLNNNYPLPLLREYAGGVEVTFNKLLIESKDTNKDTNNITLIQDKLLKAIHQNEKITITELCLVIGINPRNVKNNIAKLKKIDF